MKRSLYAIVVAALVVSAVACSRAPQTTNADSTLKAESNSGSAALPADNVVREPKVTIPAGTKLRVALLDGVSSDRSRPGDQFLASLAEPVVVDGRTIFAKGTRL